MAKGDGKPPVLRDREFIAELLKACQEGIIGHEVRETGPGKMVIVRRTSGRPDRYYSIEIRTIL